MGTISSWHNSGMRILKYPRIIQDARTSKNATFFSVVPAMALRSIFLFATEKQQQKSWIETYGWEPSLLEQIDMDVRGHNMCERMSLSRFKIKEFTFHTHSRANIVLAQCWSSISQTYTNASTALEGMVKCQKFESTREMLLPGISTELHGTPPFIQACRGLNSCRVSGEKKSGSCCQILESSLDNHSGDR